MVMNPTQELSLMRAKNAALEAKNEALEERVRQLEARAEPKPQTPTAKPPWATQSERTGILHAGEPSVEPTGDGQVWVRERKPDGSWKDPHGQWRYASGELIPRVPEPRPIGPERGHQHAESVELLDNMLQRDAAREETIKLLDPRGT
jgi:hypothetical protein